MVKIILFLSFSFFSKLRFSPCPPVPCNARQMSICREIPPALVAEVHKMEQSCQMHRSLQLPTKWPNLLIVVVLKSSHFSPKKQSPSFGVCKPELYKECWTLTTAVLARTHLLLLWSTHLCKFYLCVLYQNHIYNRFLLVYIEQISPGEYWINWRIMNFPLG